MCQWKQGHIHKALESLLNLEKSSRLAEDVTATKAACAAILDVAFEAKEWKLLEENILLLAKRRSQLKQVGAGARRHWCGHCGGLRKWTWQSLLCLFGQCSSGSDAL